MQFLDEVRRVAGELVVADSAVRPDHELVEWQERVLNDGSRHEVYKRYFTGEGLARSSAGERSSTPARGSSWCGWRSRAGR